MPPRTLFRSVAFAEAATWTLLLVALLLKYVLHTGEVAMSISGGLHGFVFLCYVASTCFIWVNQKWTAATGLLAVVSAVVPYATIAAEKLLDRRGLLGGGWRLAAGGPEPRGLLEKLQAWVLRKPATAVVVALAAVAAVFSFLLFLGPPDTWFA
jgi:integral membrane protein